MGLIRGGVLGGFRNKTGAVIGSSWRKLDVIRGLPRLSGKPAPQARIEQNAKFSLVTAMLTKATSLIKAGWKSTDNITPLNKALAYHLKEAVIGSWPNFTIDMEKFKFSTGSLELPDTVTAEYSQAGRIRFDWDRTDDFDDLMKPSDTVTLLAYNVEKQRFVKMVNATTREMGSYELQLPESFAGDSLYLYISFTSATKKINSESKYIGSVTMPI